MGPGTPNRMSGAGSWYYTDDLLYTYLFKTTAAEDRFIPTGITFIFSPTVTPAEFIAPCLPITTEGTFYIKKIAGAIHLNI